MAVVPDTHDFAAGVVNTSEDNAYIRDPIRFLLNRPMAELRQIVAQTLTTATFTAITFTAEDVDTENAHSTAALTSRYVAVYAGWYLISGAVAYVANAVGRRGAAWAVNGSFVNAGVATSPATAASDIEVNARTKHVFLNVGDYVELYGYQESGGNLNTEVGSATVQSHMSVCWVRNA